MIFIHVAADNVSSFCFIIIENDKIIKIFEAESPRARQSVDSGLESASKVSACLTRRILIYARQQHFIFFFFNFSHIVILSFHRRKKSRIVCLVYWWW